MKLSKLFRTTALATAFAFGLTQPVLANDEVEGQILQGIVAYSQEDYATAFKLFLPLAEQGYPGPQFDIGLMYADGTGVAKDFSKAVYWWQKAAKQNHQDAKNYLAYFYYKGLGVKQDKKKARKLWQENCKQGKKTACDFLKEYK